MKSVLAVLCLVILAGCSSVVMNEPFPDSQLTPEEQKQLSGAWLHENTVGHVRFNSNGVPWMAGVEWKDDDFHLQKTRLHFTKLNGTLYVCMPAESGRTGEYLFGEIKADNDKVYVWGPDIGFFARQVESGILKGNVDKDKHTTSVSLETPAKEILELISTNHLAIDYKQPLVFRKLE
jgi:hypothetical protein